MVQRLQNVAFFQITYAYKINQELYSMRLHKTLAMDEMQKDFLGLNMGRHATV